MGISFVYNQLQDNSKESTETKSTVTFTKNNNNSWTITGTRPSSTQSKSLDYTSGKQKYYENHVYFISSGVESMTTGVALRFYGIGTSSTYAGLTTNSWALVRNGSTAAEYASHYVSIRVTTSVAETIPETTYYPMVIDLTLMLGSEIADYVMDLYTNGGREVAWPWLSSYFPNIAGYTNSGGYKIYPSYNSGEFINVENPTLIISNSDGTSTISSTFSTPILRGIPELINGKIDYSYTNFPNGDIYNPNGFKQAWYQEADLGDLTWNKSLTNGFYTDSLSIASYASTADVPKIRCNKYITISKNDYALSV